MLAQNTLRLLAFQDPLAGINTALVRSHSLQLLASSNSTIISKPPLLTESCPQPPDPMDTLLNSLSNAVIACAGDHPTTEAAQPLPKLIVTPAPLTATQPPACPAALINRPESPLARERRSPSPSDKQRMVVSVDPSEFVLSATVPSDMTPDMIAMSLCARKGGPTSIKVVADLWHAEKDGELDILTHMHHTHRHTTPLISAHFAWTISNLQDVGNLDRVRTALLPGGHLSIRLPRRIGPYAKSPSLPIATWSSRG